jgi:hypothetical protein
LTATHRQETAFGVIKEGDQIHVTNSYKFPTEVFEREVHALGHFVDYNVTDTQSGMTYYLLRNSNTSIFASATQKWLRHLRVG